VDGPNERGWGGGIISSTLKKKRVLSPGWEGLGGKRGVHVLVGRKSADKIEWRRHQMGTCRQVLPHKESRPIGGIKILNQKCDREKEREKELDWERESGPRNV